MREKLIRVEAPHFVACVVIVAGRCINAAPILGWALGKSEDDLTRYFARQNWQAEEV